MIKDINEKSTQIEIDLTGDEGNAFRLIAMARKFATQLGLNPSEVQAEMMSGDYENLIEVFDSYFGDYVIMYR